MRLELELHLSGDVSKAPTLLQGNGLSLSVESGVFAAKLATNSSGSRTSLSGTLTNWRLVVC